MLLSDYTKCDSRMNLCLSDEITIFELQVRSEFMLGYGQAYAKFKDCDCTPDMRRRHKKMGFSMSRLMCMANLNVFLQDMCVHTGMTGLQLPCKPSAVLHVLSSL